MVVEEGTAPTPEIGIETNAEGRFLLVLPEGRFRVAARGPSGAYGWCEVDTRSSDPGDVVIRLTEMR